MAAEDGCATWSFDLEHWGRAGQGLDETAAVAALLEELGGGAGARPDPASVVVVERIDGDEQAFAADRRPATPEQRRTTLDILAAARKGTFALLDCCTDEALDRDDPDRVLPTWARWRTVRQMMWHVADTESRYYLPSLGLPSRPRAGDLRAELWESAAHVRRTVASMSPDLVRANGDEVWTSTKVLRRLAWHERSELVTMERLVRDEASRPGQVD